MKLSFTFAIGLVLTAVVHGQSGGEQAAKKPPKEVLQEFVKMELGGARLSAEGRRKTERFFVHSSGLSQDGKILVFSDDYEFHEKAVTENRAELYVFFRDFYGQIDPKLRFELAAAYSPSHMLIKHGGTVDYSLVRTNKTSRLDPGVEEPKEATGPEEWRIEHAPLNYTTSLATAIRYVTEMREKATDPVIKKNAEQTLTKLKKLH
jgi:hypothetical protein